MHRNSPHGNSANAISINAKHRGAARKGLLIAAVVGASLLVGGCSGNVGVGLSVGVPIGNHGYMSVGTGRWY